MIWLSWIFACATHVEVPDTQSAIYDGVLQTVPTVDQGEPSATGTSHTGTTGGTGGTVTTGGSIGLPFAVDAHFAPSGYMGDGISGGLVDTPDCDQRAGGAEGSCHRISWTPGGKGWAGIFWQYPENNWGELPGLPIEPGATQVRLWAWSDGDGVSLDVFAGGIDGAYADDFDLGTSASLSSTPTEFVIELTGATYTRVIGGFGFSINHAEPVTLFIDDIVWE